MCGCAALKPGANSTSVADAASGAYPPPASFAIEYKPSGGKSKVQEMPLEPGMTVGDAVAKTKAHKKFRRIQVDLQRTPKNGMAHKMPIDFDNGSNKVGHSTNYDLHPNDRVIITEDTTTILDDLMSQYVPSAGKRR